MGLTVVLIAIVKIAVLVLSLRPLLLLVQARLRLRLQILMAAVAVRKILQSLVQFRRLLPTLPEPAHLQEIAPLFLGAVFPAPTIML